MTTMYRGSVLAPPKGPSYDLVKGLEKRSAAHRARKNDGSPSEREA